MEPVEGPFRHLLAVSFIGEATYKNKRISVSQLSSLTERSELTDIKLIVLCDVSSQPTLHHSHIFGEHWPVINAQLKGSVRPEQVQIVPTSVGQVSARGNIHHRLI